MIGIEDRVTISPATWPAHADVAPGDLTRYAPIGLGLQAPLVSLPWDTLGSAIGKGSFYGANDRTGDPIRDAPINAPAGGVVYFDSHPDVKRLAAICDVLQVPFDETNYAVFASESSNPKLDRYLAQIRIVPFAAMKLFGAMPDPGSAAKKQELTIGTLLAVFMNAQQRLWGEGTSAQLGGTLGGDGDTACEKLSFGFMAENASNGVYRLWSRPWLVTK